jgi:hypothetical protein
MDYIYNSKQEILDFSPEWLKFWKLRDISWYQVSTCLLSEEFITKYAIYLDWFYVGKYSKLSEKFIKQNLDRIIYPEYIRFYQRISNKLRKQLGLKRPPSRNWLNSSVSNKLKYIKKNKLDKVYEINKDKSGYYLIAYKTVKRGLFPLCYISVYNNNYKYRIGQVSESQCDCDLYSENSFGLSGWTKEEALTYHPEGALLKVKIYLKDLGAIVHSGTKLRAFKLTVLEEVKK